MSLFQLGRSTWKVYPLRSHRSSSGLPATGRSFSKVCRSGVRSLTTTGHSKTLACSMSTTSPRRPSVLPSTLLGSTHGAAQEEKSIAANSSAKSTSAAAAATGSAPVAAAQ
eukprot:scaffold61507_cov57-Phaeocystis_antarctica.AAC.1